MLPKEGNQMLPKELRNIYRPPKYGGSGSWSLKVILEYVEDEALPLDIDPDFQRGHVWTDDHASEFIGFMLEGGSVPPIVVWRRNEHVCSDQVVDGKQRITACVRFMRGEIPARLKAYSADLWYDDITDIVDRRILTGPGGPRLDVNFFHGNRVEVLDLYLKLNNAGVAHTAEELDRVRNLLEKERSGSGDFACN